VQTEEVMTSDGLRNTQMSTNTNDCAGDEVPIMFPNPLFVLAFVSQRHLLHFRFVSLLLQM
jgi:hypothetical protein